MGQDENYDPLTGVLTIKWAREKLDFLVAHSSQVALIMIDVDRMKLLNDTYGHYRGDEELIRIAREIEKISGANTDALVCRFGGDEFLIVLNEASSETAHQIAEKIRASQKPIFIRSDEKEIAALTLSIGIAHFPTHVSTSEGLMRAADLALIKAKDSGRLPDGTPYIGRNRVMAIGDFLDEFPEQSAKFLNQPE